MYLFCQNTIKTDKEIIFEHTELGQLQKALPLQELGELLPLKTTTSGAPSWFDRKGTIALLFLQSYTQLSDRQFINHLNGNWQMQMFCGIQLPINTAISDLNLMSRVRKNVSSFIDLEQVQQILFNHWKNYMENTHVGMCDATVYESALRYPTDVKLLWECCQYVHDQLEKLTEQAGFKLSRRRFDNKQKEYLSYARTRKKPYKRTLKMRKTLLGLLEKLVKQLQKLLDKKVKGSEELFTKLHTVKTIITQQQYLLTHKGSKIRDRILSLHKPYVRAIVRGKETKSVEFGAKVHMMQIDGINYIEHFSFDAFNESTRLRTSILKHKKMFGACTHWSADAIYATNKNRRFTTSDKILTNFVPKGRSKNDPHQKTVKDILNKVRSTVLEGSFGTEKNYYGLAKVKARTEQTEKLYIYFSVMTANAVKISQRIAIQQHRQVA
jgi:transposase, IS5 family